MLCPSCKKGKLLPGFLDDLFRSHTCSACGGNWIYLSDYLHWLNRDKSEAKVTGILVEKEKQDTKHAMVCPVTGNIMLKYRLSSKTTHRIDLSPSISAIWLDKNEWELIKNEGLSRQLNRIFTQPWQRKIKSDQAKETLQAMYIEQFGEDKYAKLKNIRSWLDSQDDKHAMLAYLLADKPYSV